MCMLYLLAPFTLLEFSSVELWLSKMCFFCVCVAKRVSENGKENATDPNAPSRKRDALCSQQEAEKPVKRPCV